MIILKNHPLPNHHGRPIVLDLFFNKTNQRKPLVIFAHGYKGYKDWGVFGQMQKYFVEEGFVFLRFNFSHNGGTSEQPIDFPDLEAFGNNNYMLELDDLQTVIDWISKNNNYKDEIETSNIILIGHSRGGAIATLKTAEEKKISKLVTWAAVCDLNRSFFEEGPELDKWKKEGVLYVLNGRTKQKMPHYIQFYENFIEHQEVLNVETATKKITVPHLIIHGDGDHSVPVKHAKNLHRWNPSSVMKIIPNANHVFGAKQPWLENHFPKDFELVLKKTINFIK